MCLGDVRSEVRTDNKGRGPRSRVPGIISGGSMVERVQRRPGVEAGGMRQTLAHGIKGQGDLSPAFGAVQNTL